MSHSLKRAVSGGLIAGAAIAVVGLTTAFAAAAPTYTIKAGTKTTGTEAYTAKTTGGTTSAPSIKFVDITSNQTLNCVSGTAAGTFPLGPKHAAAKIGTITKSTWTTCTGPFNLTLKVAQSGTWYVNGSTATTSAGVTKGYISNASAKVTSTPDASTCTFTATGGADGTYTNSTGKLALKPVTSGTAHLLTVGGVSGCFGIINNGDQANFTGTYVVTTADGKVSVTSP